ncbi:MAG TPA: putative sporulation protein YtxC [Bacillota bacterium]|nr:putative sporulation protein YtxC [Bacillota bacterium]
MLEIYFESNEEVIRFCDGLFRDQKQLDLHWKTDAKWGNHLQFNHQLLNNDMYEAVARSMVDVFVEHRLTKMIKGVVEKTYYYTNKEEIERILDLTHWIISSEEDQRTPSRSKEKQNPLQLLMSLFLDHVKDTNVIHFDSIVNFRLNVFKDQLIHYVGLAIDEFKREEDHQSFINMLREYISRKEAAYEMIHILQGENFSFFAADGHQFSHRELRTIMQKEPLYIVGLDGEEYNLAPLIAMAPEKIKIYGDHPSEPKTLTVINVFQEKVDFEPIKNFPYTFSLNH